MGRYLNVLVLLALSAAVWSAEPAAGDQLTPERSGLDGAPMVLIPAGEFEMGSGEHEGEADERPKHRVYLDAYYIDRFQVTVSRYAAFIEATKREPPRSWSSGRAQEEGEWPVVGVDWLDAEAYCQWAGRRLPTEAEWEKAARGADGRKYPWGNEEPTSRHANFGKQESDELTRTAVGRYEAGKSPYGVYDLAGNVWEWTADWYDENYYRQSASRNPQGPPQGLSKATRGGSWDRHQFTLRSANRNGMTPTNRLKSLGVRCAQDGHQ
ncbi:MAG: formylglycine-generating enzyme family protein [Nitrospiraceae bacterium]